jgi:hypothetical protein
MNGAAAGLHAGTAALDTRERPLWVDSRRPHAAVPGHAATFQRTRTQTLDHRLLTRERTLGTTHVRYRTTALGSGLKELWTECLLSKTIAKRFGAALG